MSVVLFIVGALAFVAGLAMIGFGIPIKEFSFGNTLIAAGTPVAVGGLIIIGLGAVVSKLRQLNETLNARTPLVAAPDMFEATIPPRAIPPAADVPFPRRPRATEPERTLPPRASEASGPVPEKPFGDAPVLPNPELAPSPSGYLTKEPNGDIAKEPNRDIAKEPNRDIAKEEEEKKGRPLPPPRPMAPMPPPRPMAPTPPPAAAAEGAAPLRPPPQKDMPGLPGHLGPPLVEPREERSDRPLWRAPPPAEPPQEREPSQPSRFDAMWPADEAKPTKPAFGADSNAEPERPPRENVPPGEVEPEMLPPGGEQLRAVAILKSGVVDGMGYTLYVDGSIEAELPQGTLRFASITELRGYLQNNA